MCLNICIWNNLCCINNVLPLHIICNIQIPILSATTKRVSDQVIATVETGRRYSYHRCPLTTSSFICMIINLYSTVEPRHTTTPLIRPLLYYDDSFVARTNAHTFSYLKTPLIRTPRYYDQRPPFGVISSYCPYEITPLI